MPGARRWTWAQLLERWPSEQTPVLVVGTGLDDLQLARECGARLSDRQRARVQVLRGGARRLNQLQPFADDRELARVPATLAWAVLQRHEATMTGEQPAVAVGPEHPRLHLSLPERLTHADFWIAGGGSALSAVAAQSRTGVIARETPLSIPCDRP